MAVSPEDLAAGALALQTFVAKAKYVEMVVDIAFVVVPTLLGFGAAGLIGSAVIRTAKDVVHSISLLKGLGQLRLPGKGGRDKPPTPTPTPAPAPAAMAAAAVAAAGRKNPEHKTSIPIILQPPTIKIPDKGEEPDKGEGRNPDKGEERENTPL
jgi:hypothetical protein